jgi:S-adenosylmethionine:tRNA ribosyltransferase-isomerase
VFSPFLGIADARASFCPFTANLLHCTRMRVSDFDYDLPLDRIAQYPAKERDASRLLLLDRSSGKWEDRRFAEMPQLLRGDELLVVNNARVIPARLFGRREGVRSQPPSRKTEREHLRATVEVLLTRQASTDTWEALVHPGKKVRLGERIHFGEGELEAEVVGRGDFGLRTLRFVGSGATLDTLERIGHIPLPPYIDRPDEAADRERYQTIFASVPGAVAAPTAGLHFTPAILEQLRARNVEICELTLHVGLGTFQPIRTETLEAHVMHAEAYEIPESTAARITAARLERRPVVAVGTTVVRALEDAAAKSADRAVAGQGSLLSHGCAEATLFIHPGFRFRVVDALLTNFHLPRSSLLALVCAFAGRGNVLAAYRHAVDSGYRFYSYGDCMLIR